MRKVIAQILAALFLTISMAAQNQESNLTPFDEFPNDPLDHLLMRIDAFHVELSKNPNASGLVRIHGGAGANLSFPFDRKALYTAYLINSGKIDADRLLIQLCDVSGSEEIRTQHFVVPPGIEVGDCDENFIVPTRTRLVASKLTMLDKNFEGCCEVKGFEPVSDESREKLLVRLMKAAPGSAIYLVGYQGNAVIGETVCVYDKARRLYAFVYKTVKKTDSVRLINQLLDDTKKSLVGAGVEPAKILTMPGGLRKDVRAIEFWFVPQGGEIPKPQPDYFPKKKRSRKK